MLGKMWLTMESLRLHLVSKADAKRLPSEGLTNTSPESEEGAIQRNNHIWFRKLKGEMGGLRNLGFRTSSKGRDGSIQPQPQMGRKSAVSSEILGWRWTRVETVSRKKAKAGPWGQEAQRVRRKHGNRGNSRKRTLDRQRASGAQPGPAPCMWSGASQ